MKLATWARQNDVTYHTAYRWFRQGIFPDPIEQLPNGTILVRPRVQENNGSTVVYARVSSLDQKADLDRQIARITLWATKQGISVDRVVKEIGSGLNGKRVKLMRLLADASVKIIVVEHRERFARFGAKFIESALKAANRKLLVIDEDELNDDLVQDMIDVLTSFCARLYGRRSAKNRAKKALEAASQ